MATDYVTMTVRIPDPLADRVRSYASETAKRTGCPCSFALALRTLLERGLAEKSRSHKPKGRAA